MARIDIELRRLDMFGKISWEFKATSSFGQDWLADELGLRNTGAPTDKLTINSSTQAYEVQTRMKAEGLTIATVPGKSWGRTVSSS